MAVMGLRLAARSNGVARCTARVSRRDVPAACGPTSPSTRCRSARSPTACTAARGCRHAVDALLTRVVGEDWHGADAERVGPGRATSTRAEAWATLNDGRDELVRLARQRLGDDVLDPRTLTIGFARRFATYKRATLLLSDPDRLRAPAARRRPAGAVRVRRQGPPRRHAGQGADPADRAVRPPGRRPQPLRVPRRLRHLDRPGDVPRLRRVAEHAAPPARGVRHERDEGGAQRRAELQHPRRLVGRVLRRRQRLGHRVGRRRPRPGPPRPARGGEPVRRSSRTRSCRSSTTAVATACRASGWRWCSRPGRRSARRSRPPGWCATTRPRCTSRRPRRRSTWPPTAASRRSSWRPGASGSADAWDDVAVDRRSRSTSPTPRPAHPRRCASPSSSAGCHRDDVVVEVVHGPLGHDGEFRDVSIVELQPAGDGDYTGEHRHRRRRHLRRDGARHPGAPGPGQPVRPRPRRLG